MHRRIVVTLIVLFFASVGSTGCVAQETGRRIQGKAHTVEEKAKQWVLEGRNPSYAMTMMQQAKQAFDSGNAQLGESCVDKALAFLDSPQQTSQPRYAGPSTGLYANPQMLEIAGYDQDAMEPCISLDGKYLFFNNSNELKDTHIFWARRESTTRFKFMGLVPGTHLVDNPPRGDERELAPSLDRSNRFYYTSPYSYPRDLRTICAGQWREQDGLKGAEPVKGNIGPTGVRWVDMDCSVSPDGNTMIISRAYFPEKGMGNAPSQSYLILARRLGDGSFQVDQNSDKILKQVSSPALQYAPAITADGLELYFTRCENSTVPTANMTQPPLMQTMVAFRKKIDEPFGRPYRIAAIDGFAEAPSLTLDKQELFFHKKVGDRFRIFRLQRARK